GCGGQKQGGRLLWCGRGEGPVRGLGGALVRLAFIMRVGGWVTPRPASIGASARGTRASRGLLKVSRHPSFVAFALFGFAHMLMNGWVGDLIFFGTFPLLGIVGGKAQDARKLREIGDSYRKFMDQTSFFPGLALISGRLKWASADV